ncbi:MAG TPA: Uma2 family endonuclease [Polyangia bacterium]|jgi:Uma2 family endonuclease|nr:Uma2 family endonuclease [Polyangia bacterium]
MLGKSMKRRATYADIEALPEGVNGEILNGELIVSPRPAPLHAQASSKLMGSLGGPFDDGNGGPGGWRILFEPELHLHGDVVIPDLAGWRRERMPRLPKKACFELPPDWVCEVLSPSTAAVDRAEKMSIYGREGVAHLWFVDPVLQTLEVFRRLEKGTWEVVANHRGAVQVRAEPFDALELDLTRLWEP